MLNIILAATGPYTGGWIIGIIALTVCVLIGLSIIVLTLFANTTDGGLFGGIGFGVAWILVTVGVWLWASWPLSYKYHHWIPTDGVVQTVNKRIVSDGDGNISEKFVLRFKDGRIRAVNDTAAATLRKGDTVHLRCKKAYDFGVPRSAHGWDCKWAGKRI